MKILVDKEGNVAIHQLCDVALKAGGMANLKPIQAILTSTVEERLPVIPTEPPPGPANETATVLINQKLNEKK